MSIEDDLEVKITHNEETPDIEKSLKAIDEILNEKNLDLKSRLTTRNVKGIITVYGLNKWLKRKYKIENTILSEIAEKRIIYSVSEKGKGREEMIEMCKGLSGHIQEQKEMDMLKKALGGNRY